MTGKGYWYKYKKPSVAASVAAFAKRDNKVLVIVRRTEPFKGKYAFPGGFLDVDKEDIYDCAAREFEEETGGHVHKDQLILVDVRSDPKRDPREHVMDIGFLCIFEKAFALPDSTEEAFVKWIDLGDLNNLEFAFDHRLFAAKVKEIIAQTMS